MNDWLRIERGNAPMILSIPHAGTWLPDALLPRLVSPWRARKDADWYVDRLYDVVARGVTVVATAVSRSVIDVNRDPSGASLYPGQFTTGLCPIETFDGEPLYRDGMQPDTAEIEARRRKWFDPYHAAIDAEVARLRALHPRVVVYDAHSIRSHMPRLFDGQLPVLNLGTNGGAACVPALRDRLQAVCAASTPSWVVDGRFRGGWITRRLGRPDAGIDAVQMELACAAYLTEPETPSEANWPPPFNPAQAAPLMRCLDTLIEACLTHAGDADEPHR